MSEFRHDPLSSAWVLISEARGKRPQGSGVKVCPFCPGNENLTPPAILRIEKPADKWQVRVVPNKFNVLSIEPQLERVGAGVYLKDNGVGAHEVIIEHPHDDHRHPAELSKDEWIKILETAKARMKDLVRDRRFKYPVLFKNHGESAGASISHPHWQLIVLPIVPRRIEHTLDACLEYYLTHKCCLICQIIKETYVLYPERLVWENKSIVVWSPFAARFPYELMMAPNSSFHQHRFEWLDNNRTEDLAAAFMETLKRLRVVTKDADFNIVLFTSPWFENDVRPTHGQTAEYDFHWYFQILPRTTRPAGFELGTGFYINPKSPESAASELRNISF